MKKSILSLVLVLFLTTTCFARVNENFVTIEELMYIFYFCLGFSLCGLILCIINYFSGSKVLNIVAWIAGILTIITSQVITHTDYSMLSAVIPSVCLMILFAKMEKTRYGARFLRAYLLKSVTCVVAVFNVVKMILELAAPDFLATHTYPYQVFLVLFFDIIIAFLVFNLLKRLESKRIELRSIFQPILWSIIVGAGAYFINIGYMEILSYARRYNVSISYLLLEVPYLNIFVNLFFWALTGTLVYLLFKFRQRETTEPS